ncbi:hypothetical protein WN72_23160 [Bradyrhizobium arachidis]|uniref:Uncharacterized protein n=1 Tax=Bradyrhizobium arachidis TaxID=858423 RepID=A0AAE7TH35_9BRAD|nr:hypothetical protein WN72_23160 [Bradyrhizobium arachidis]
MDEDPLIRRAERAIYENLVTRTQVRKSLLEAKITAARVQAAVQMVRMESNRRTCPGMGDRTEAFQENPAAKEASGSSAETMLWHASVSIGR